MKKYAFIVGLLACGAAFAQQPPAAPQPPQADPAQQMHHTDRGWHKGMRDDLRKFNDERFAAHKKAILDRLQAHTACVSAAKAPADLQQCRSQRQEGPGEMRAEDMRPPRQHFRCQGDGCQGAPKPQGGPSGNAADRLIR